MDKITISIETTNDAFVDDWKPEVKRMLQEYIKMLDYETPESIRDINGNKAMTIDYKVITARKDISNILVTGRRWFQKSYGNTYHSVTIKDVSTGEILGYIPFVYGYDDGYKQTAFEWFIENGYYSDKRTNHGYDEYHDFCNEVSFQVIDVNRKRDL